jgi:hypothetical protein
MDLDLPINSLSVLALCAPSASAHNSFAVPNVRELRDAELQVCPDDEFVVTAVQRDVLWRQRFVESGSGVEPVWSMVQYHEAPEVGVAAVSFISTDIDPTNRIEVYVFKRTGTGHNTTKASECFERFQFTPTKNEESPWWTINMNSRCVSHIVKKEEHPSTTSPDKVSQEISVHFCNSRPGFDTKEKLLHVFSFENKCDRQQYPSEIQTVRDTMVLGWLINLNTSPHIMLNTLRELFQTHRGIGILAERKLRFFRDLNDFHARNGRFPRGGYNRGQVQASVTFGPIDQITDSSFESPVRSVAYCMQKLTPDTPPTVPNSPQSRSKFIKSPLAIWFHSIGGSVGSPSTGTAPPTPHTVQLADGRKAKFCLMGNWKNSIQRIDELETYSVRRAAGGGENGNSPCNGGLYMWELQRLISHFRVCDGMIRRDLISMLRELLTSFGIPYGDYDCE